MQKGANPTLEEAFKKADVFLGLSKGGIVNESMIKKMARNPIVFALANPNPEIEYDLALKTRDYLIMATGRSGGPANGHSRRANHHHGLVCGLHYLPCYG